MKPLTIEELKALEVGDWVWVVKDNIGSYGKIEDTYNFITQKKDKRILTHDVYVYMDLDGYGRTWFAYKNKEKAEGKGEIITNGQLLRNLSDDELASFLCSDSFQKLKMSYTSSYLGVRDWLSAELTKEETESRLQELRGENE